MIAVPRYKSRGKQKETQRRKDARTQRGRLTRISHQLSAAADDAPCPAVFSRLGMLDGQSSTTPRPSGRKPHWTRHLAALATKPGEKCGLKRIPSSIFFFFASLRPCVFAFFSHPSPLPSIVAAESLLGDGLKIVTKIFGFWHFREVRKL